MATVTLRYFALFREILGRREERRPIEEGQSAQTLLDGLVAETPALAGLATICRFVVNQSYVDASTALHDGDEVVFIPPVSGGQAAKRFAVVEAPLVVESVAALVADPGAGAVITFAGVVRDNARGRGVSALEYEAYGPVAEQTMAQIGAEMRARWPVLEIAIWHRTGLLAVGETSVVIALSVPHRQEGFAACAYAIERLKEIVPIWKKEFYAGGETWIGSEAAYQGLADRRAQPAG